MGGNGWLIAAAAFAAVALALGCIGGPEGNPPAGDGTTVTTLTADTLPPGPTTTARPRSLGDKFSLDECEKISDTGPKETCMKGYALRQGDAKLCEPLTSPVKRDMCVYDIAVRKKDPRLCARIAGPEARAACEGAAG
jgi:hypothetical protein